MIIELDTSTVITSIIVSAVTAYITFNFAILKELRIRFSTKQFDCYIEVWNSLCVLDNIVKEFSIADKEKNEFREITPEFWKRLYEQLDRTKDIVKRNSILIERKDLDTLNDIFSKVNDLQYKDKPFRELVFSRLNEEGIVVTSYPEHGEILRMAGELGRLTGYYEGTLDRIQDKFRNRIRG